MNKKTTETLYAKYLGPAGFDSEEETFKKLEAANELIAGNYYVVTNVDMGSCITYISLKGVSEEDLNSVAFSFYKKENSKYVEHDIYKDPTYNPYIGTTIV